MVAYLKRHIPLIAAFLFFFLIIVLVFGKLPFAYFEADDWFHFTAYLPLTREPGGIVVALIKSITDAHLLSGGQHFVPIGGAIYFLNTLFFGIYFPPYAFMSLMLHVINSFLVFLLIKSTFTTRGLDDKVDARASKKNKIIKTSRFKFSSETVMALLGGTFFALSAVSIPNITWAAFYGQNVFSVTLFLLCILSFKNALVTKKKVYLYASIVLLILDVLTKETASALFIILPIMALLERKAFSLKHLAKFYVAVLILFLLFRFVVPQMSLGTGSFTDIFTKGMTGADNSQAVDTGTILSTDLSIHKNIKAELLFRTITFPTKMVSEMYFPRVTVQAFVTAITPIVYPLPGDNEELNRTQTRQFFINGPGNDFVAYLLSIVILIVAAFSLGQAYKEKQWYKVNAFILGFTIVVASTLPLVMIVLSLPRWGYDTYFDLRHYYLPSIGGAILFPLLLFAIARYINNLFSFLIRVSIHPGFIVAIIFAGWFVNNMAVVQEYMKKTVDDGIMRKNIIYQIKQQMPKLADKAVISVQTDGLNAYGSQLPFQTGFAQILSVIYYDTSPLPDSFYEKPILDNKGEGYQYADGRGLGYYTSKKSLADDLLQKKFTTDDIYAFSYISGGNSLNNTTQEVRAEMKKYLQEHETYKQWMTYEASTSAEIITMQYPPEVEFTDNEIASTEAKIVKDIDLNHPDFTANIQLIRSVPTFDLNEALAVYDRFENAQTIPYKAEYDIYHFQDVLKSSSAEQTRYSFKVDDLLIVLTIESSDPANLEIVEKIFGSVIVTKE